MPGKSNAKNLKPNSARSPEELRAMGAKGGRASAEARRRRKRTQEKIKALMELKPKLSRAQTALLTELGCDPEEEWTVTAENVMLAGFLKKAMDGELECAEFLYRYGQILDGRGQLERERIRAVREGKAKDGIPADDPLKELLARWDNASDEQQAAGHAEAT